MPKIKLYNIIKLFNKLLIINILLLLTLLTSCSLFRSNSNLSNVDTGSLSQLENLKVRPIQSSTTNRNELSQLRIRSLRDTAMSVGAQGGLSYGSQELNAQLDQDREYLSTIFNFGAMMLSHGVLPPVLEESNNNLNLADSTTIRVADKTYKIVQQARFATTPPNWREYLWLNYPKPILPDRSLLPKSAEEQRIWKQGIKLGWERGIQQAYSIFQQNLARLRRDYQGMILYRKLLQAKMINPPFVARTELGITGNGTDMRINDQVLRIVDLPKLQTNGSDWNAVVIKHE
jgi:defect-in-organelle-trafficking protein DotC